MTAATTMPATVVASSDDRAGWLAARRSGVTATDVAKIGGKAGAATWRRILADKRGELAEFSTASMSHGSSREAEIARWISAASRGGRFGSGELRPSHDLYACGANPRHLATPDGIAIDFGFFAEIVEVKTTVDKRSTPPAEHVRQMQWQMHVLGADRCLYVWEQRDEAFQPVDLEPRWLWVKRDQEAIDELRVKADELLRFMDGEQPDVDPYVDGLIARRVAAAAVLDEAKDALGEIDDELRQYIGDASSLSVMGTVGDLSWSRSVSKRFSSTAFREDHPDLYAQYLRETPTSRLTVTPVQKREAAA